MKKQATYKMRGKKREAGYVLVGVMIITAVCLLMTVGLMEAASSSSKTLFVVSKNTKNFYEVEESINKVTAWLQNNSKNIVTAFDSSNFATNFELSTPQTWSNQGADFAVPTMIKIAGTSNAVQLTNSSYFGTSAFPTSTNIDTGAGFDAISSFQSTDFGGGVHIRLLAVWALQTDGHYQPIFRVDAVTGASPANGVHGINFIKSALVSGNSGTGYYAENGDFQTNTPNNQCWSYVYSWNAGTSTWSRGAPRSNCLIAARDDVQIKSAIHGSVLTMKTAGLTVTNGGSISGSQCAGATCGVTYTLPNEPEWNTRCGAVPVVDVTSGSAMQDISAGGTLASQCYRNITIPSNKGIRFVTPDTPYYIKSLAPQNNSNSKIYFQTVGPGHKYILYVDSFSGNQLNGNQMVGTNLAPHQLEIYLTKDGSLLLNGTASMNGVFIGRANHTITANGNFTFNGALRSNAINIIGNMVMGYDEELGGAPALSDINFTLFKASQRYR